MKRLPIILLVAAGVPVAIIATIIHWRSIDRKTAFVLLDDRAEDVPLGKPTLSTKSHVQDLSEEARRSELSSPPPSQSEEDRREFENIAKLRELRALVEHKALTVEKLAEALSSSEGYWLKAAYLQAAALGSFSAQDSKEAFHQVSAFLERLGKPAADGDPMEMGAYYQAFALLGHLNRDGSFDEKLKEQYGANGNHEILKAIQDPAFKIAALENHPREKQTEIIREDKQGLLLDKARSLIERADDGDQLDLQKYIATNSSKDEWKIEVSDNKKTRLSKLNGIALSKTEGKAAFIHEQWNRQFYTKLDSPLSAQQMAELANPTHELAYALWTESDLKAKVQVETEILNAFARDYGDSTSLKAMALTNFAVAYIDMCVTKLIASPCDLETPTSFAYRIARKYLAVALRRPDAQQALGSAKHYVESVTSKL